ncbi:MAG: iron-containing alcohol dehydrogenase, partial [Verrucomicrobiota bacterium]
MISRNIALNYEHRAIFTRTAFAPGNDTLRDLIADALEPGQTRAKVIVFIDAGLLHGNPTLVSSIEAYFQKHEDVLDLVASPNILPGGESSKNQWPLVEQIWEKIHDGKICRHSYVIAIGGGAVLDLVGFAASTAHRGVRHIRFPTTTLSQGDGGVGVKNGVNFFSKKNWVGAFAVPFAIINDVKFLQSLPKAQRRAGVIEAIKVALIRDRSFFEFIEKHAKAIADLEEDA